MKKLIATACVALISVAAIASTVESSNIFGVLKVDTGNTSSQKKQNMIGVPWVSVGAANESQTINPTNLVLATGLVTGDSLLYSDGSTITAWTIDNGAWKAVQVSSGVVTDYSTIQTTTPTWAVYSAATTNSITRGQGLILETAQQYIHLSGQYEGTPPDAQTVAAGGNTLFGNYSDSVATVTSVTNAQPGDKIYTNSNFYEYNGTAWTYPTKPESGYIPGTAVGDPSIPAGTGAWYYATSAGETRTINF